MISDLSVNHIERHILRCGFSVERIAHDYGLDLLMFTYAESGEIENGHVELQVKATDRLVLLKDGKTIAFRLAAADVRLWIWEPFPVILVVYDASKDRGYWPYVQNYSEDPGLEEDAHDQVTLHIPLAQRLNRAAVERFRKFRDRILDQMKGVISHG